MSWNYRVIKRVCGSESFYGIHEVYYYKNGEPNAWSANAMKPHGETLVELQSDMSHMAEALTKPIMIEVGDVLLELGGSPTGTNPVVCLDCGIPYADMGSDLVLPDQQWKVIFPEENGLLCANCICKRVSKQDATSIMAWVANMNYQPNMEEKK